MWRLIDFYITIKYIKFKEVIFMHHQPIKVFATNFFILVYYRSMTLQKAWKTKFTQNPTTLKQLFLFLYLFHLHIDSDQIMLVCI